MSGKSVSPAEYAVVLATLKDRLRAAQVRAMVAVNRELVLLYWQLGREILDRQAALGWAAHEHGWSRNTLVRQIEGALHRRQGGAISNFARASPSPASELVQQTLKDPYLFDFLELTEEAQERDIERAMVHRIHETLQEMGLGFAYVGRQVKLEIGGDAFFVDLLFYQLKLHCYVVVELKAAAFAPEHAGKLNSTRVPKARILSNREPKARVSGANVHFYLSAVDDLLRDPQVDAPSIGILLCRGKNRVVAEYALRDIGKPIGVAELQLTRLLPDELQGRLPTVEALEAELASLRPSDG